MVIANCRPSNILFKKCRRSSPYYRKKGRRFCPRKTNVQFQTFQYLNNKIRNVFIFLQKNIHRRIMQKENLFCSNKQTNKQTNKQINKRRNEEKTPKYAVLQCSQRNHFFINIRNGEVKNMLWKCYPRIWFVEKTTRHQIVRYQSWYIRDGDLISIAGTPVV